MKFSLAVIVLCASTGMAQTVDTSQIPSCALSCFASAASDAGCGITDYKCQCTTGKATITKESTPCIKSGCSQADAVQAAEAASSICAQAAPSGSASASGSGSSVSSASASVSGSSSATGSAAAASSSTGAAAKAMGAGAGAAVVGGLFGILLM